MYPTLSIIIPTANRPLFLPRAVESALACSREDDVEVIVVPNGADLSWQDSLKPFNNNQAVRTIPIREAHANIARNIGMDSSRGEFIRFLDDDDYLIPEGAIRQYDLIKSSDMDVVSGSVELISADNKVFDVWRQPDTDDFCSAILGPDRVCHLTAHIFRKTKVANNKWNKETSVRQDFEWLFDLSSSREIRWKKIADHVGAWKHHWGSRISSSSRYNDIRKLTIPMLVHACNQLIDNGLMTDERRKAVASGIWGCVHAAFFLDPNHWRKVAGLARDICPNARPPQPIYNWPVLNKIDPILLQWIMFPKRRAFWHVRQLLNRKRIKHAW